MTNSSLTLTTKINVLIFKLTPTKEKTVFNCHLSLFKDKQLSIKQVMVIITGDNKGDNRIL